MKYTVTENNGVTTIYVIEQNIFFAFDQSDTYSIFRNCLVTKGIDVFVDLLIEDSNTAFLKFTDQIIKEV
jgi:hypothetical protein